MNSKIKLAIVFSIIFDFCLMFAVFYFLINNMFLALGVTIVTMFAYVFVAQKLMHKLNPTQ